MGGGASQCAGAGGKGGYVCDTLAHLDPPYHRSVQSGITSLGWGLKLVCCWWGWGTTWQRCCSWRCTWLPEACTFCLGRTTYPGISAVNPLKLEWNHNLIIASVGGFSFSHFCVESQPWLGLPFLICAAGQLRSGPTFSLCAES